MVYQRPLLRMSPTAGDETSRGRNPENGRRRDFGRRRRHRQSGFQHTDYHGHLARNCSIKIITPTVKATVISASNSPFNFFIRFIMNSLELHTIVKCRLCQHNQLRHLTRLVFFVNFSWWDTFNNQELMTAH